MLEELKAELLKYIDRMGEYHLRLVLSFIKKILNA